MVAIDKYLSEIRDALRTANAHNTWFGPDRKAQCLRLGREIGFGLADYSDSEINDYLGVTYGTLVVINTLDSVGVPIDNKDWVAAIRAGINKARGNDEKEGRDQR